MYILHTKSACPTVHGIDNAQLNSGIVAALCLDCLAKQPELGFSKMLEQITSLVVLLEPAKRPEGSVSMSSLMCLAKEQEHVWSSRIGKMAGECSDKWREPVCSAMLARGP